MVKIGEKAPDFEAKNQDGTLIKLSDLRGKKVVLYFYPKDDTPGCTKEACSFRDLKSDFRKKNAEIIGISRDSVSKHKKFALKYELPFDLIADEEGSITEDYGVWVEKSMYGRTYMGIERTTFLIDENGIISAIWPKVKVAQHAEEVLQSV